jgi:hypothetical protein
MKTLVENRLISSDNALTKALAMNFNFPPFLASMMRKPEAF